MPVINGKQITFRARLPARDNWDLPELIRAMGQQGESVDMRQAVPVLARVVASWEFDGDPHDPNAYGDLDLFRELIPLVNALATHLQEILGTGESGSASI